MSDTPTTAEQVALDALARDACCHLCAVDPDGPWVGDARAVVAALRNSPAALADLNGGDWVRAGLLIEGIEFIPADLIPADGFAAPTDMTIEVVHRFVPKGATDGDK